MQGIDSATTTDYSFYFANTGKYDLTLYADNGHLTYLSRTLTVNSAIDADFDFLQCTNQFVNISYCADQFLWNFGDGDTSALPLPIHKFSDTGTYTVKLKAWKGSIIDSVSKTVKVDVLSYPDPSSPFLSQVIL